jgi:5-methylcytosine-specific restriction protein B
MTDTTIDPLHEQILAMNAAHRPFALPVLRAVHRLGGSRKKRFVIEELRRLLEGHLDPPMFDELYRRGRFGWVRLELKHLGLLGGEHGTWALTELGTKYVESRVDDVFEIGPINLSESARPAPPLNAPTEPVAVSSFRAYQVPILKLLARGGAKRKEVIQQLGETLRAKLLPGDLRIMPRGDEVWQFRAVWQLTELSKLGHIENQSGVWTITESGRQRVQQEGTDWDLRNFPPATAEVLIATTGDETPPSPRVTWASLRSFVPAGIVDALQARLCPDLGPRPEAPIPRNVILYGPPGTGKTHTAKLVARALTDDDEGGSDGRFRLIQFHPSYAYEDFIQGLKPDLKKTELRYAVQAGPFLQIVEDARAEPNQFFVLIIDEINRGDPARIFGELLYALEYRDEAVMLPLGGELVVPSNLVIIGTMNSVDRSVALVDYALRRRFGFVRVDPDPAVVQEVHGDTELGNIGALVLRRFNDWLGTRLGREYVLGHSFFIGPDRDTDVARALDRVWTLDVHPLLEEYFFGDADGIREATATWRTVIKEASAEASEVEDDE